MGKAVQGGAVNFDDLEGSPQISGDRKTRSVTRNGLITWSSIDALIAELFPAAPSLPGAYPGVSYLYAQSFTIRPQHENPAPQMVNGDVCFYTGNAAVTIQYSILDYDESDLIQRNWNASGEIMTMPSWALRWEGQADAKNVLEGEIAAGIIIPHIDYNFTFHRVTTIPWTNIQDLIGKVNDDTFEDAAATELLFMGAQISWKINNQGTQEYSLDYMFKRKIIHDQDAGVRRGWNYFMQPTTGKWLRLVMKNRVGGVDKFIYDTGDFSDLF